MTITQEQFNKLVTKKEHKQLDKKVDSLDKKVDSLDKKVDKIQALALSTKEDLKEYATKNDLISFKDEILTAIDGLANEHKTAKIERVANQAAHDRFQVDIDKIKKHIGLKASAVQVGA